VNARPKPIRRAASRFQHAAHLAERLDGVNGEHETFTAENDIIGSIALIDRLEIQRMAGHVPKSARGSSGKCKAGHFARHVGQDNPSRRTDTLSDLQSWTTDATRELEYGLARGRGSKVNQPCSDPGGPVLDIVGALVPGASHS